MAFDPAAATAAYLAQLPPDAHVKAAHYTHGGEWLHLWSWLVSLVVALIILKTGVLYRTGRNLQRRKPKPWLAAFVVSVVYLVMDTVLSLPWAVYTDWYREKSYGMTSQPLAGWLVEHLIGAVISLVIGGLFLMLVYWIIRRAPRLWPVLAGVLAGAFMVIGLVISPLFIEPIFNHYTPAPPGAVRDEVVAMGRQVGVPTDKIYVYNGSKQSNRYTANVSGLFGSARVAMSDVMFAKGADLAEVRGVVGHEMGHYVRKHILFGIPALMIIVMVSGFLAQRLFPVVQRWTGAEEVAGIADPAGLPILMIVVGTLGLLLTPVTNSLTRIGESDADSFSLRHFNEPDGLAKALVKTIEYRAATPNKLEEIIFYDHPSVGSRVRKCMEWKATHPKAASSTTPTPVATPAG